MSQHNEPFGDTFSFMGNEATEEAEKALSVYASPLETVTTEAYEELGLPHGLSSAQMMTIIRMVTKGVGLNDIGLSMGLRDDQLASISVDEKVVGLCKAVITHKAGLNLEIGDLMQQLQVKSLHMLNVQLPSMTAMEQLAVFTKVNAAKAPTTQFKPKEVSSDLYAGASTDNIVELTVVPPQVPKYITNDKSQIIEVDGRPMDTLSIQRLQELRDETINSGKGALLEGSHGGADADATGADAGTGSTGEAP